MFPPDSEVTKTPRGAIQISSNVSFFFCYESLWSSLFQNWSLKIRLKGGFIMISLQINLKHVLVHTFSDIVLYEKTDTLFWYFLSRQNWRTLSDAFLQGKTVTFSDIFLQGKLDMFSEFFFFQNKLDTLFPMLSFKIKLTGFLTLSFKIKLHMFSCILFNIESTQVFWCLPSRKIWYIFPDTFYSR